MSDEKIKDPSSEGISLDELPSEDPLKAQEKAALRRIKAFKEKKKFEELESQDVRARNLAGLPPELQLQQMSKVYEFDKKEPRYEILALYLLPLVLKYTGSYEKLLKYLLTQTSDMNFLLEMLIRSLSFFSVLMNYAELIVVFLIIIKTPLRSTPMRFIVNFEGIDLPAKLRIKSTDLNQRRRIKWAQIHSVRLNTDYVDALELLDNKDESLGMLRWDLWKRDKKSFEKIISKYVGETHPLRRFLHQDG